MLLTFKISNGMQHDNLRSMVCSMISEERYAFHTFADREWRHICFAIATGGSELGGVVTACRCWVNMISNLLLIYHLILYRPTPKTKCIAVSKLNSGWSGINFNHFRSVF